MQVWFNIQKSINTIDHISKLKKKKHGHLNRCKKVFDTIQHYGELQSNSEIRSVRWVRMRKGGTNWKTDGEVRWLKGREGARDKERDGTQVNKKQALSKWQAQKRHKKCEKWRQNQGREEKRDHEGEEGAL